MIYSHHIRGIKTVYRCVKERYSFSRRKQVYRNAEAFPEAHSEFELCLKRYGEAFFSSCCVIIPLVYCYLGQVQEDLNNLAADESHITFLEIKKRGDSDLP